MKGTSAILALAGATAACMAPGGPPEVIVDRTACDHCRMLVSEPRLAGAYRLPTGEERVFDDPGCLRTALAGEPQAAAARVWVHDFDGGDWVDASVAWFVTSANFETPMGSGVRAYASEAVARRAATGPDATVPVPFDLFMRGGTAADPRSGADR